MKHIETRIRTAQESGDIRLATNLALESYGQELFGFIVNCVGQSPDADDIFSLLCEDIWHGLARFEWRSSLRTWAYALARNATARHLARADRRHNRNVPLSEVSELMELAEKIRTTTAAHLRTTHKNDIRDIRKQLPVDDQMLLVLRIDRNLSWRDIVVVMESGDQAYDEETLKRAQTRMRKRFERIKEKLREMAVEKGLL